MSQLHTTVCPECGSDSKEYRAEIYLREEAYRCNSSWHSAEPAAGTEGDAIVVDCSNHFGNRHEREIEEAESLSRATQPERPEPTAKKFNCVRCDFSSDDVIEAGNHGMACPIPSLEDAYESLKQSHASLVKALEGVLGVISTERGWGTWDRMESSALYEQASEAKKIADAALDTARKVQP